MDDNGRYGNETRSDTQMASEKGIIVGIDFGTCYTSAAVMTGFLPVTTYLKDTTGMGVPSLFMYSEEEQMELFGEDCLTGTAFRHPNDVIRNMKRMVREDPESLNKTIKSGGRSYTLGDVIKKYVAFILDEVKNRVEQSGEFESSQIAGVAITAPVGIASGQMMATDYNRFLQDAVMEITGLDKRRVMVFQEPVAGAISYLYSEDVRKKYTDTQRIMVFDLGGGTLDVSIVEHDPATMTYEIKAKEGDLRLGGNDWDDALAEAIKNATGTEGFKDSAEEAEFMRAVTKLKADLTEGESSMIFFSVNGDDKFTRFKREDFEKATAGLLGRAMDLTKKMLDSYEGDLSDIDKIVLVGGSSNMPQIKEGIAAAFPDFDRENIVVYEPSKAISKGAAVYSKLMLDDSRPVRVKDISATTYGFDSMYESTRESIYNMIYKNTPFEDGKIRVRSDTGFVALKDSQTAVTFTVYESASLPGEGFAGNFYDLGKGETPNGMEVSVPIPQSYYGRATQYSMYAEFVLDSNGILELIITDPDGNRLGYTSSAVKDPKARR